MGYETWTQQEQEQEVLQSLKDGFTWVGFMPANVLPQDNPYLPDDGRKTLPALMRLYKKGLVIRNRTRRHLLWGLPGYVTNEETNNPGYFDSVDAKINAYKPQ